MSSAENVAKLVYAFVTAAGAMVDGLAGGEHEDEAKLLRVRTKKNELVIFPGMWTSHESFRVDTNGNSDAKYLLVVIHDTPPA